MPSSGADSRRPAGTNTEPARTSSPAGGPFAPDSIASTTRTSAPSVAPRSSGITQSAPEGTGASAATRTASPHPTVTSGGRPVSTRPASRRVTGALGVAPTTSAERAANPSLSAAENGGMSYSELTSMADTQP